MELLSKKQMTDNEERGILKFLDNLMVIPLNEDIEQKAIELRRSTKLKLPDSIIAATSIVLDAILLTDDVHLLNLSLPDLRAQRIF